MSVITEVYLTVIGIFVLQFSMIINICCFISKEGMIVIQTLKWTQIFVYVRPLGMDSEDIKSILGWY
jgi:hypothetical protein